MLTPNADIRARATALVPAYQAAGFIQATLDSLSAQTYGNFSVIISVDACEDDSYAICAAHAARDNRFSVVRQDRRLGYVGNCNFLLKRADADYVCFAFHDDILLPNYVESLCVALDAHPEAILAYSDLLYFNEIDGSQKLCAYTSLDGLDNPVARGLEMFKLTGNWWVPNRGLFRLSAARKIGGLRSHGAGERSPDLPWLFHMSLRGEFVRVPDVLCHKYSRAKGLVNSWGRRDIRGHAPLAACWREIWLSNLTLKQKIKLAWAEKWVVRARMQDLLGGR